ncbi:unnamed protein product [Moneuplotes crassus]|uniref:Uncharacterized protein n=1 Tax=Euplotes crassus TaxID=5936 RepID=A0AAD1XAU0_EUPCR|nr:unnamed protein product [Moneuplotes crassus]
MILLLATIVAGAEEEASPAAQCRSCLGYFTKKWCNPYGSNDSGFCCDITNNSGNCNNYSGAFCVDKYVHTFDSSLLACPKDFSNCGQQNHNISIFEKDKYITQHISDEGTVCVFNFTVITNIYDKVKISTGTLKGASVQVYLDDHDGKYKLELVIGDTKEVDFILDAHKKFYVLVKPMNDNAVVSLWVEAYSNATDVAIIIILIISFALFLMLCGLAIFVSYIVFIKCKEYKKKNRSKNLKTSNAFENNEKPWATDNDHKKFKVEMLDDPNFLNVTHPINHVQLKSARQGKNPHMNKEIIPGIDANYIMRFNSKVCKVHKY